MHRFFRCNRQADKRAERQLIYKYWHFPKNRPAATFHLPNPEGARGVAIIFWIIADFFIEIFVDSNTPKRYTFKPDRRRPIAIAHSTIIFINNLQYSN